MDIKNNKKLKILKMKDNSDSYTTKKELIFNLPARIIITSPTGGGKSGYLGNLLLRKEYYRDDFEPENIFIFSGSVKGDQKLNTIIDELEIPSSNIFSDYDEQALEVIYEMLVDNYNDNVEDKVKDKKKLNSLIIFDDLAFNNSMKATAKEKMLKKIFMNGRKFLVSSFILTQRFIAVGKNLRENASGYVMGKASNKEVNTIEEELNFMSGKDSRRRFIDAFKETTNIPFGKFIINFSNYPNIYYNQDFETIKF